MWGMPHEVDKASSGFIATVPHEVDTRVGRVGEARFTDPLPVLRDAVICENLYRDGEVACRKDRENLLLGGLRQPGNNVFQPDATLSQLDPVSPRHLLEQMSGSQFVRKGASGMLVTRVLCHEEKPQSRINTVIIPFGALR